MIAVVNTFQVASGKGPEAKDFLSRWNEKCNKANPETKRYILEPASGEMNEIATLLMYPALAAYDEFRKKPEADPEFQALRKEVREASWFLGRQVRMFDVVE